MTITKKIILIIVTITALIGIGAIIYYGRETLNIINVLPTPATKEELAPPPPFENIQKISSRAALNYLSLENSGLYYANPSGQIIAVTADGKENFLSESVINDLRFFAFAPNGGEALVVSGPPENAQLSRFVIADKVFKPLNKSGIVSAAWSPDSKKIAYLKSVSATGENELIILDISKEKTTEVKITSFALADYGLEWPSPEYIILKPKPSILYEAPILAVNPAKKTVSEIIAPATGLIAKWSAPLKQGLLFRENEREANFSLITDAGKELVNLSRVLTLPDKCAFNDEKSGEIFCAVPKELPARTVLSEDYFKRKLYTDDEIYSLTAETDASGKKQLKVEKYYDFDPLTVDADNLAIKNGKLYFINRYDEKIYSLDLSE